MWRNAANAYCFLQRWRSCTDEAVAENCCQRISCNRQSKTKQQKSNNKKIQERKEEEQKTDGKARPGSCSRDLGIAFFWWKVAAAAVHPATAEVRCGMHHNRALKALCVCVCVGVFLSASRWKTSANSAVLYRDYHGFTSLYPVPSPALLHKL